MLESQGICRLKGYNEFCDTPYNGRGTDAVHPGNTDFALMWEPLTEDEYAGVPDLQAYPLYVTGITPFFNIPGVTKLALSGSVLSRIFRGCWDSDPNCIPNSITYWNHSDILALNDPSIHSALQNAGPIMKVMRQDTWSSTYHIKNFLNDFDADFGRQIALDGTNNWTAVVNVLYASGPAVMAATVHNTPSSIGYLFFQDTSDNGVSVITFVTDPLNPKTSQTTATVESINLAASIVGPSFGNDGSDPARLHIHVGTRASVQNAWPMSYYVYVVVRKDFLRPYATCATRNYFREWYEYIATDPKNVLASRNFVPLPAAVAVASIQAFHASYKCNGTLVYRTPGVETLVAYSSKVLWLSMDTFASISGLSTSAAMEHSSVLTLDEHVAGLTGAGHSFTPFILADENTSSGLLAASNVDVTNVPLCIVALGFVYQLCLPGDSSCPFANSQVQLDPTTIAAILYGTITSWDDPRILNQQVPGTLLPNVTITIGASPFQKSNEWLRDKLKTCCDASFEYNAVVPANMEAPTQANLYSAISSVVGSFAFVAVNSTSADIGLSYVAVKNNAGQYVLPSAATAEACARDTYQERLGTFDLAQSQQPDCYPLVELNSVMLRRVNFNNTVVDPITNATTGCRAAKTAASFLKFMTENNPFTALNIGVPGANGTLVAADTGAVVHFSDLVAAQLSSITCEGQAVLLEYQELNLVSDPLTYGIYALAALCLTLIAGLALWVIAHRQRKIIRNSSPVFLMQVLMGAAIMISTVFALGQQDGWLAPIAVAPEDAAYFGPSPYLDSACRTQPVLFSVGFFIMFSAIFLKAYRLIRIFENAKLRKLFVTDSQLLVYEACVLVIIVVLNLLWGLVDPLVWVRSPTNIDPITGLVTASAGVCFSRGGVVSALPLFVGILLFLVLGNYVAYRGRTIPTEFNESKWTAMVSSFSTASRCPHANAN